MLTLCILKPRELPFKMDSVETDLVYSILVTIAQLLRTLFKGCRIPFLVKKVKKSNFLSKKEKGKSQVFAVDSQRSDVLALGLAWTVSPHRAHRA